MGQAVVILKIFVFVHWIAGSESADGDWSWIVHPILLTMAVVAGIIGVIAKQHIAIRICCVVVLVQAIYGVFVENRRWWQSRHGGIGNGNSAVLLVVALVNFTIIFMRYAQQSC